MAPDPRRLVDMSPRAVADRIATVGQLYRVCMSLMRAVPLPPPSAGPDTRRSVGDPPGEPRQPG